MEPKINPKFIMTLTEKDVEEIVRHYFQNIQGTYKINSFQFKLEKEYEYGSQHGVYKFQGVTMSVEPTVDLLKK